MFICCAVGFVVLGFVFMICDVLVLMGCNVIGRFERLSCCVWENKCDVNDDDNGFVEDDTVLLLLLSLLREFVQWF